MPSMKLLSWNIQKFGEDKVNDANFMSYVAAVIRKSGADVAGIMEIVGWIGGDVKVKLVTELNNQENAAGTGIAWIGVESEMTPSRPNEQYVYVWKNGRFGQVDWSLYGVVGETVFDPFFTKYNTTFNQAAQELFWARLYKNKYLDAAYQLTSKRRAELDKNPLSLDLTPDFNPTNAQKQEVVKVLLAEEPALFPSKGSRPPFFLLVETADVSKTKINLSLYHAPGPGNALPIIASYQIAYVEYIRNAGIGVLMGDFNVDASDAAKTFHLEYFNVSTNKRTYVLDAASSYVLTKVFQPLIGPAYPKPAVPPIYTTIAGYAARLWGSKTSLSTTLAAAATVADASSVAAFGSSEYDKFFVKATIPDPSAPYVVPVIDQMVPKTVTKGGVTSTTSTTLTPYEPQLATAACLAFNAWWNRQNAKKKKPGSTSAQLLASIPKLGGPPETLREAQYVYRYAISDHMPIVMELQYA